MAKPEHFAPTAHLIVAALRPEGAPPMPDTISAGTTTWTQRMVRAHFPDGRIRDSEPEPVHPGSPTNGFNELAAAFGRMSMPKGTRFERFERTVTVTATDWAVVESGNGPTS